MRTLGDYYRWAFANKNMKHDKLSCYRRDGLSALAASTAKCSCLHFQGSIHSRIFQKGSLALGLISCPHQNLAMAFQEVFFRANWLACLAFPHRGLSAIFKEPECVLFPMAKCNKGLQIIFLKHLPARCSLWGRTSGSEQVAKGNST
jgi:hypothetical protein